MFRTLALATATTAALVSAAPAATFGTLSGDAPIVIAHRGASGYLPEHTLAAYELGIAMGADIVEPDLQETADGQVIAMHDATLTRTTNVAELFAPRNGDYRVSDFTLAEIRTLTAQPTRTASFDYPGFTPSMDDPFRVPTFQEVIDLVAAHNAATGERIGLYPEAKAPSSDNLNRAIVASLAAAGFNSPDDRTYVQTFSHDTAAELARLQEEAGIDNFIVALGAAVLDGGIFGVYDSTTRSINSLEVLAGFVDGVGVSLNSPDIGVDFISAAHTLGLEVHGWTFRPTTLEAARDQFAPYIAAGMDGFFTDYPDLARTVVNESLAPIPLPAGLPLLALALAGLGIARRVKT